ncbi:hypothetical protein H6784_02715 [Candidatus Nomurabacteria bacterium]|nr:hypothetical protein [Candidatus Nomurabacteria bacterium]
MENKPWVMFLKRWLLSVLVAFGMLTAQSASAQTTLPTSVLPAKGEWKHMVPSSFDGTIASAFEQCERDAALSDSDPLTLEKCDVLKVKLTLGECKKDVMVPDGIVFDILTGRQKGQSRVWFNMLKNLGRDDLSELCDLNDGVYAYWFSGIRNQSCNNVAFVFVPQSKPVAVTPPKPKGNCRQVPVRNNGLLPSSQIYQGFAQDNCCCEGSTYIPTYINESERYPSNGYTIECD